MKSNRSGKSAKSPRKQQPSGNINQHLDDTSNYKKYEPVSVYCRVRPLPSKTSPSCLRVDDRRTIVLTPPEHLKSSGNTRGAVSPRETQYIFKVVYEPNSSQEEIFNTIAHPLVENLVRGRNSLLFAYGVTGSGKTFTMTGDEERPGIMPRCLDSLFRTISEYQAERCIFKPDHFNSFEILSAEEAAQERQSELKRNGNAAKLQRKKSAVDFRIDCGVGDTTRQLMGLVEDNMFAVFITYIEVYNNSVYDLLEEATIQRQPQCKIIREDGNHNMYVHAVTEIEIKSVGEAMEAFQLGQKRKRMGQTILNAESSRSHSVFNIRLVQAPIDSKGEYVVQDKSGIVVSQLSLVDLAGSERSSRTHNTGARLREAGNINNSLMTLRTCLEYLRENQQAPCGLPAKKIPYRDSKITHLFKNYFDGEGQVSMILCINPRLEDCDENIQVMKFAEMTQEVQVTRGPSAKVDPHLTPGRRNANKMHKKAMLKMGKVDDGIKVATEDVPISLGGPFPESGLESPRTDLNSQELMGYLMQRIEKRKVLSSDFENRWNVFRATLVKIEDENRRLHTELESLKLVFNQERDRRLTLENRLRHKEKSLDEMSKKFSQSQSENVQLKLKLKEAEQRIRRKDVEKEKEKRKLDTKLAVECNKMAQELETKLQAQRLKLEKENELKEAKLKMVSDIIQSDGVVLNKRRSRSTGSVLEEISSLNEHNVQFRVSQLREQQQKQLHTPAQRELASMKENIKSAPQRNRALPVANTRHRRSHSSGDRWLEHRNQQHVPVNTVLQPYLRNRRSVKKLTEAKDLVEGKATKYCLIAQEADTDGEIETKLYKGNVIPTCGGGAQVVFDDVECLKQVSPMCSPKRGQYANNRDIVLNINVNGMGVPTVAVDEDSRDGVYNIVIEEVGGGGGGDQQQ